MSASHWTSRHRRYHSYDNPSDHPGFSQHLTTDLGSPFLTTSGLPSDAEFVDGTPVYVPYTQTITRPSSPTPTVDSTSFSIIHHDPDMPRTPFKSILPRLWHVISPGMRPPHPFAFPQPAVPFSHSVSKGKSKIRNLDGSHSISQFVDYTDLPPLDGEEGELITIDDEACFFNDTGYGSRAVTGIDILALLPTELSLYILALLCTGDPSCSRRLSIASSSTTLSLPEMYHALHAILACLAVSKTWRNLAADNTVWRALFLSRWSVDLTRHRALSHRHISTMLDNRVGRMVELLPAQSPSPATTPIKGFKMRIRKRRVKHLLSGAATDIPSFPGSANIHHLSPFSSSRSTADESPQTSPNPPKSHLPSPSCSPFLPLSPLSKTMTLTHAPLQINWYALYRDRLELDKRWNGTARAAVPSNMFVPGAERKRMISFSTAPPLSSPSTSAGSSHSVIAQVQTPHTMVSFAPQVLSIAGHTDSVYCLELDSRRIITGSRDRTIKVWSLRGKLLGSFGGGNAGHGNDAGASGATVQGHTGSVLCLKFSADWDRSTDDEEEGGDFGNEDEGEGRQDVGVEHRKGKKGFMVSGSSDCTVCVWDVYTGGSREPDHHPGDENGDADDEREVQAEVRAVLRGHVGGVLDLRIDKNWIVSCSKDAVICVWDRKSLGLCRTLRGHEGPVNAVGLQSGRVVSASGDGKMILWDIASGERIRTFEGHDRGLACIEFKDDLIVSGSNDCKIKVWSASTGACIRTLMGHEALVRALSFDPGSGRLVSASYDKSVKVWDLVTGKLVREFKNTHTSHIFDVKFDVARIVSTSHDQKIVVLDFSQGLDTSIFA